MLRKSFANLVAQGRVVSARVVPVPMESSWCIDVLVKDLLAPGASASVLEEPAATPGDERPLARFASIDAAARELKALGVSTFEVDVADAISFTTLDSVVTPPLSAANEPAANTDERR